MTLRGEPRVLLAGLCFPEGPRWHKGQLYVSDMHGRVVAAADASVRRREVIEVPGRPSGLGFDPDGRLHVVSMTDRKLLRLLAGALQPFADLSQLASGHCNDMVMDAHGRAYVGNFGFDFEGGGRPAPACLAIVEPDGSVSPSTTALAARRGAAEA